jgi:hypothetical protein
MYFNVAEILDKLSDFGSHGFVGPQSLCPFCMVSFFAMEFSTFFKKIIIVWQNVQLGSRYY